MGPDTVDKRDAQFAAHGYGALASCLVYETQPLQRSAALGSVNRAGFHVGRRLVGRGLDGLQND
jgi:hypothetical protein